MSRSSEIADILQKHSPEQKKKKLYEYDSVSLAKAAFLETLSGAGIPSPETMGAEADRIVQEAVATVREQESIVDVQTTLLRSQLQPDQQKAFDAKLADYSKAQARSQRGLLGAMTRQKKLSGMGMQSGRLVVTDSSVADSRLQYLAGMQVKSPRVHRYIPQVEATPQLPVVPPDEVTLPPDDLAPAAETAPEPVEAAIVPTGPEDDEFNAVLLDLLGLRRLPDGSLETLPDELPLAEDTEPLVTPEATTEEPPAPIAPETVMMAEGDLPDPGIVQAEAVIQDPEPPAIEEPPPEETPEAVAARSNERPARRERFMKRVGKACGRALKKVCRVLTDVTPGGLARAALKTALPVAGAALPILAGDMLASPDPIMTSIASATIMGGVGTIAANSLFPDRRRSGKIIRQGMRQGASFARNLLIGALTAVSISPDAYNFQPLVNLANYAIEGDVAHAGERFDAYQPAIDIFRDPAATGVRFFSGDLAMDDLVQANSVQVQRTRMEGDQFVNQEVPVTAKPIVFVDKDTGEIIFSYYRAIFDPLEPGEVPDGFLNLLDVVEELPSESPENVTILESLPNFEAALEAELGPLEQLPADTFFLRLLNRNVIQKLLHGDAATSGASTVDMQFFKNAFGREGEASTINPEIKLQVYHPEHYSVSYLFELIKAARRGEVLDPQEILNNTQLQENEMAQIDSAGLREYINQACQQYERYMYGKFLALRPGYELAYLNNLRLGSVYGREVIGVQGISWMMFDKSIAETTKAEQLIILSSIPQGSKITSLFENGDSDQFTYDMFRAAVETNAERAFARGELGDEADMEEIRADIADIFDNKKFFGEIPDHMFPGWIQSEFVQGDMRGTIEETITATMPELAARPDVTIGREEVFVPIDVPDFTEPTVMQTPEIDFSTERVYDPVLRNFINGRIVETDANGFPYFQGEVDGKIRRLPAFEVAPGEYVPGVGVVVVDETGELVADYDETGFLLTDAPVQVGSTMKPFIYAFGRYMGYIDGPKDMTNDTPGRYALAEGSFDVVNSSKAKGKMTWEQALAQSRNVPFQRVLHYHLYHDLNGLDEEARYQEVGRRWKEFTDFLAQFDIKLVNVNGEDIVHPADKDPTKRTELAAIGTDVFITSTENSMQDGRLVLNESSMGAFARAYMHLQNPQAFFTDQRMIEISDELPKILKTLGLARTKETGKADESWAKTGTVFTVKGTTGTLTAFVVQEGDKSRVVVVHTRGQVIDDQGQAQEMDLDVAFKLAQVGNESFKEAYPFAKALALETLKYDSHGIISTDIVEDSLIGMLKGGDMPFAYQTMTLNRQANLVSPTGEPITALQAGAVVDAVGEPENGMQQVVVRTAYGQSQTMRSGFVMLEQLSPMAEPENYDITSIKRILGNDGLANLGNPLIITVGPESTSPLLSSIYAELAANNDLAGGAERFGNLEGVPANALFINTTRLHDYTRTEVDTVELVALTEGQTPVGDEQVTIHETETTRALLQAEMMRIGELGKFYQAATNVGYGAELTSILNNPNSAAYRLLQALSTGRGNGYRESPVLSPILFRTSTDLPVSEDLEDIPVMVERYSGIMGALDTGAEVNTGELQSFMFILREMNDNPTQAELVAMGIESPVAESPQPDTESSEIVQVQQAEERQPGAAQ